MDLLEEMGASLPPTGVRVECGQTPPRAAPVRHTSWNNSSSFTFAGWVAILRERHCQTCDGRSKWLDGVFTVEIASNGTRRLTRATDWPAQGEHTCEVVSETSLYCDRCIQDLGFRRTVPMPRVFTLIAGEGASPLNATGRHAMDAREQARVLGRKEAGAESAAS